MKRPFSILSLVLVVALLVGCSANQTPKTDTPTEKAAADSSLTDVKKRGKLQIGMSGEYPPFASRGSDGKLVGFDVDFTTEIAHRLGVEPEFVTMPFKGLVASLDSQRFDMIANQMAITPERQQKYAFSTPYVQSGSQLLVRKDDTSINSLADVKGKKFAASAGSNYEKILKDAGAIIEYYTSNANIYNDIAVGRIDGSLNDRLQVAYIVHTSGLPLRAAGTPEKKVPIALMFRQQGSTALVEAVNKAYADMQADGTYLTISKKWFNEDASK